MSPAESLRIAHVQPMTLDLFGHRDEDFGTKTTYSVPNLAYAQARRGHRPVVHLLTSGRPKSLDVRGLEVHFHRCVQAPKATGLSGRFGRQLSWSMVRALRAGDFDLVHFHGLLNSPLMLAAVTRRARRERLPLVAQDHGSRVGTRLEAFAQTYSLRHVTAALAGNEESADALRRGGIDPARLFLVPNGYDPQIFHPPRTPRARNGRKILVVSRLTPEKDPLTMSEAVALLGAEDHVSLTVVGRGPLKRQVAARLASAVRELELIETLPQQALAELYRSADVLLMTSLGEGSNQVVLEAMASGLPVVASDVRGIRDVVCEAGLLVPAGNPAALARGMRHVFADPGVAAELSALGIARARPFTWDAIVAEVDRIYEAVLQAALEGPHRS